MNIKNFTGADAITISTGTYRETPLVTIVQRTASLSFQFDMHPCDAMELAAALVAACDEFDKVPA